MSKGVGIDIIEVARIKRAIERHSSRLLSRLFTQREQQYCQKYEQTAHLHFAGRFAAKEAVVKALGIGFGAQASWLDIEIVNDERGKPKAILSKRLQTTFGKIDLMVSISHCKEYATAIAIW